MIGVIEEGSRNASLGDRAQVLDAGDFFQLVGRLKSLPRELRSASPYGNPAREPLGLEVEYRRTRRGC